MPRGSKELSLNDKDIIFGFSDVEEDEVEQLFPTATLVENVKTGEDITNERLDEWQRRSNNILERIDKAIATIDKRCDRFQVASKEEVGSPLFQSMVRVFDERTTTIKYSHYKRALALRTQLAAEDSKREEMK